MTGLSEMRTAQEAATALGYHIDHVYRLLKDGTIRGERFNGVWIISPREIARAKSRQDKNGRLWKGQR